MLDGTRTCMYDDAEEKNKEGGGGGGEEDGDDGGRCRFRLVSRHFGLSFVFWVAMRPGRGQKATTHHD